MTLGNIAAAPRLGARLPNDLTRTTLADYEMPLDKTPVFVGGKGVYVSRIDETSPLQAVVFPIATGGSRHTFTHPDGTSTSTVINGNTGWDKATLKVTDTTTGAAVEFTTDAITGASVSTSFPAIPTLLTAARDSELHAATMKIRHPIIATPALLAPIVSWSTLQPIGRGAAGAVLRRSFVDEDLPDANDLTGLMRENKPDAVRRHPLVRGNREFDQV